MKENVHIQLRFSKNSEKRDLGRARSENTFKNKVISFLIVAGKCFLAKKVQYNGSEIKEERESKVWKEEEISRWAF